MASVAFREGGYQMATGGVDYDTNVIKVALVMTNYNGTVDSATLSAITVLDEMDGSGFTWGHGNTGRKTFATAAVVKDTSARVDFESGEASTTWASLGAGTRSVQGALIHKEGAANDTTAYCIAFAEFGAAAAANGQDFVVNWDSGTTQDVMRWTFT